MEYTCPRCSESMDEVCATCGFIHKPDFKETLQEELIRANTRIVKLNNAIVQLHTQLTLYGNHIPETLRRDMFQTIDEALV